VPADPRRAKELFLAALDLSGPQARQALLDRECGGDAELRRRVAVLLAAHDDPASALDQPLAAAALADPGATASLTTTGGAQPGPAGAPAEGAGTVLAGRYRLLEEVGEGGMGTVWLAEQTEPVRRQVAVKLVKAGMDSGAVLARFEAERQALALMDHPNIAKVLDGGTTPAGRPFFVMEYVRGLPVTEYCDGARLTVRERLELLGAVCQAVQHAHQKGLIHRDLKPSNILVAVPDGKPVPKVIDFGLAKAVHQPLTEHTQYTSQGTLLGTPLYMSPEQTELGNPDVDTRTDVYALGVILYELLTGTTPLERERLRSAAWPEVLRLIKEEEPRRPSARLAGGGPLADVAERRQAEPAKLARQVRGELDWIVMKCLEKDRGRRYETANGLATDVRRYLDGEPVLAVPPSPGYRLRKFLRRHRGPAVAAGLVVLALAAGLAGTLAGLVRADGEARRAQAAEADAREQACAACEQRDRAAEAAAEARAISRHLTRMLGELKDSPRPGARSEDLTIRELLDQAARDVGTSYAGRPALEAAIRHTIGENYEALGALVAAREQLERALRLRDDHLGPGHPESVETAFRLARCCHTAGLFAQAERLYQRVIAARTADPGRNHPDALLPLRHLGTLYVHWGQFDRGEAVLVEARDGLVAALGPDHPDSLEAEAGIAQFYTSTGRPDRSGPILERVLRGQEATLGPDHPNTLLTARDLGWVCCLHRRESERAESLLRRAGDGLGKALGPRHAWTLQSQGLLARFYQRVGRFDEAEALWRTAEEGHLSNRVTKVHFYSAIGRALACWAAGRRDVAASLLRQTLEAQEVQSGGDDTRVVLGEFGEDYQTAGRPDVVIAVYEQLVEVRKARVGGNHPATLTALQWLADARRRRAPGRPNGGGSPAESP
jgi:serine/threonine protein kinase/tetratricopeptide (TPR) repeat protein